MESYLLSSTVTVEHRRARLRHGWKANRHGKKALVQYMYEYS